MIVFRLAEYPITELLVEHEDADVRKLWTDYMQEHLDIRSFQVETGLDYHVYGIVFVSIHYPLVKTLKCTSCGFSAPAKKLREHWSFVSYEFKLRCPHCGVTAAAQPNDIYPRNPHNIRLIRWNPENIESQHNEISGEVSYFYNIPNQIRNDVMAGKKEIVETTPQLYLQAIKEKRGVKMSPKNLFVLKRPNLSGLDRGWGLPIMLPLLKDAFYLQIMKKSQETNLLEHLVPLRVLYPQPATGSSDPFTLVNLTQWREFIGNEIARWRMDPGYIPIAPIPIGQQSIGGDGKALLLQGEINSQIEQLIYGTGVPKEFVYGGMSWSGTNVSLRMLENMFLGYIQRQHQLVKWIVESVSAFTGWPKVGHRFKPFKMADDIQRRAFDLQLNAAGKLSDESLLANADYDASKETEIALEEADRRLQVMKKQQLANAKIQGEAQLIMTQYQVKAQQAMAIAQQAPAAQGEANEGMQSPIGQGNRMEPGTGGLDLRYAAQQQAMSIAAQPQQAQQIALQNLAQMNGPEFASMVQQMLAQMNGANASANPLMNTQPLPEQRAPRREASAV